MTVQNESRTGSESVVLARPAGVYASLFEKINLNPVSELSPLDSWQDAQAMSEATADERLTAGMQVFLECLTKSGSRVEKLDKTLIDHHIAALDYQISRQLDAVMHHDDFQAVESLWRGVKSLVDKTDFRQNVKIELLDLSKDDLRRDFEDSPEIIQSGLYLQTYVAEYDTPGGEPVGALISAYEFDASAQDVALLRNISKVSAAAHMPFIGSAGPKFFLKESMEEVAAIKDIGNYFDRAEYIKWKSFRETDDARYIGLVMPRVLGRLPYGPDTVPVRSFSYVEEVKGPDHDKYLWTNASFAFASNMVRSFINNGWCVQIRGPQAGGAVQDLPIHLYDLGTGNQVKIPSEVMIPETREFEFANLGFIPLSYYKNRDYACFFSANSAQMTALRKLRSRPVDGLVWVTSVFDQLSAPGLEQPLPVPSESTMDSLSHAISARMEALGWKLPLYVWSLHPRAGKPEGRITQATGCLLPTACSPEGLTEQLSALTPDLTSQGLQQTCRNVKHNFLLTLADQLIRAPESVTAPLSVMLNPYRPLPLAGVVFSQPSAGAERAVPHHWAMDKRWDVLPESVRMLPAALRPVRPGIPWRRVMTSVAALAVVGWVAWMGIAYVTNRNQINGANARATLASRPNMPPEQRLLALSELQKTLARLQYRSEHGVPWYEQAGLSQNNALLAALWPRYQESALPLLRDAAADHLQTQLNAFNALPPGSPLREQMAKTAWTQLKLYLMLARPEHMNAAWFSTALLRNWPTRDGVKDGVWQGLAPSLLLFYGAQLAAHPEWKLRADEDMVSQARSLLVRLTGVRNSESTLYQKMLSQVAHLYADMRLEDMTGDTDASRLFSTTEIVPGMFTRQAWEQAVQPAIDKVVKARRDELDWVLTDGQAQAKTQDETSPEALKERLTARYFADFGSAWLEFLNSLRWSRATTLSDSIDQLTLMADVRQSPLVTLMNTLNVQGRTGQSGEAISDSLVKSAKNLLAGDNKDAIDQSAGAHGPLDATFGPVLALMDRSRTGNDAQSLPSYLTRVTQVRLRLQQVTSAADPQAMTQTIARTVFQGKAVDLTETRDYGSLIAAGLGQEWSGFGRTVFVTPMEQAWQQVLTPAADSLNAQWQQAVVAEWNSAFGGRYPFNNASSDVSLPLLAKYLNADSGRIAQFLQTRLKGVLHKEGSHWVPDSVSSQGLTFNPAFLSAVNTLSHISDVAFTEGNAGMHFELRPGTAGGVMQTDLIIDSQKLTYVNQMPAWKRFTWPADTEAPGASLSWISTEAGTRQYAEIPGAWGWIRLLDRAEVTAWPGVGSSYGLSWKAQDGRTLNYTLRTEAGEGPLALLKLRHFRLPESIFSTTGAAASGQDADSGAGEVD